MITAKQAKQMTESTRIVLHETVMKEIESLINSAINDDGVFYTVAHVKSALLDKVTKELRSHGYQVIFDNDNNHGDEKAIRISWSMAT